MFANMLVFVLGGSILGCGAPQQKSKQDTSQLRKAIIGKNFLQFSKSSKGGGDGVFTAVDINLEGLLRSMKTSGFSRTFIHFDFLNPERFYIIDYCIFMLLSALPMVLVVISTYPFAAGVLCTVTSFTCATSGSAWVVMGPASSPVFT